MGSSENKGKCSFGQKEFDISNMGETGLTVLKIYQKSTKHSDFPKKKKKNHLPILKMTASTYKYHMLQFFTTKWLVTSFEKSEYKCISNTEQI